MSGDARKTPRPPAGRSSPARIVPLRDAERDELQALLDAVPPPLEPFDVAVLDGFLCGVLVQPQPVPPQRWLPHVTDADGRPLPRQFDATRLHALLLRRHAELDDAIQRRAWFDPWVFESDADDAEPPRDGEDDDEDDGLAGAGDDVYPWVAGFVTALELFPALMAGEAAALTVPLALLYRHLDPDDLEDADEVMAEIESMEPPADLADAVEGLVRATLLLADVGRPLVVRDKVTREQVTREKAPTAPNPRSQRPRR